VARQAVDEKKSGAAPAPQSLSEIKDESSQEPAWIAYQEELRGTASKQAGVSPTSYGGLIDGDTFDGGDGQVGTVGSGDLPMPKFKQRSTVETGAAGKSTVKVMGDAMGGSESKKTQKNVFGYVTGYAEKLKDSGMSQVDEYGEDKLAARRQQLEN